MFVYVVSLSQMLSVKCLCVVSLSQMLYVKCLCVLSRYLRCYILNVRVCCLVISDVIVSQYVVLYRRTPKKKLHERIRRIL